MSRRRQRTPALEREEWFDPYAEVSRKGAPSLPSNRKRHFRESETESENDDNERLLSSPSSIASPVAKRGTQLKRSLFTVSVSRPGVALDSKTHTRSRASARQPLPPVESVLRTKRPVPNEPEWDDEEEDTADSINSSEKSDSLSVSSTDSERGQLVVESKTRSRALSANKAPTASPAKSHSKSDSDSRSIRSSLRPVEVRLEAPKEIKVFPPLPRSLRTRGSDYDTFVLRVIGDMDSILPSSPPARKQARVTRTALFSPLSPSRLQQKPSAASSQQSAQPKANAKRQKTMNSRTASRVTPVHLNPVADAKATATFYSRVARNHSLLQSADTAPLSWAHLRQPAMTCRTAQGARRLARRVFRTIDNTLSPFEDDSDEEADTETESAHSDADATFLSEPAVPDFVAAYLHLGDRYVFPSGRPIVHLHVSTRGSSVLYSVVNPSSIPRAKSYVHCPSFEAIAAASPLPTRSHKVTAPKRPAIFPFDEFPPPRFVPSIPEPAPALKRKPSKSCVLSSSSDEPKPTRTSSQSRGLRVDTSEESAFSVKRKDNKRGQSRNSNRSPQARSHYVMESPHKVENRNGSSANTSRSKSKRSVSPVAKASKAASSPPSSPAPGTAHSAMARRNKQTSAIATRTRGGRSLRPRAIELPE